MRVREMVENITAKAYEVIADKKQNIAVNQNLNHQVIVYVQTPADNQTHKYFHSLSIDKQVEDFMGTCELRCVYDSSLMEYWEPIRNYCVVYGGNHGKSSVKILFIGRVREIKQDGYELVITLQDYGWKFKQLVTQSYANDYVIGKDGYTIMKLIFESLKIDSDSWVISPSAKNRLKQVGIDSDGNVLLNKKKVEEMPDLLNRLKNSNPRDAINKWTVYNKIKESELHNIKNINYTLKYEKPTPVMKNIISEGENSFSPGSKVYDSTYGSQPSGVVNKQTSSSPSNGLRQSPPKWVCSQVKSTSINSALQTIWMFNGGYTNDYSKAKTDIVNYAINWPLAYKQQVSPCLGTLSKRCNRKDKINAATLVKRDADKAMNISNTSNSLGGALSNVIKGALTKYSQASKGKTGNPFSILLNR